jgi:hypothetical protein
MNEETTVNDTPTNETETVVPETTEPTEEAPVEETEVVEKKQYDSVLAQKEHFREKAAKETAARKFAEDQLKKSGKSSLDVEDYIDISASLDGLDQREKEFLARQHKLTGKPLSEIRKDDDFILWQGAYRQKVEKERSNLKPTSTQSEADKPSSFEDKIQRATSMAEKEKLLSEAGLYKAPKSRVDRAHIGSER